MRDLGRFKKNEVYVAAQENNIATRGYPTEFVKGARKCDCDPILQPKALRVVSSFDLIAAQSIMKRITDRASAFNMVRDAVT